MHSRIMNKGIIIKRRRRIQAAPKGIRCIIMLKSRGFMTPYTNGLHYWGKRKVMLKLSLELSGSILSIP